MGPVRVWPKLKQRCPDDCRRSLLTLERGYSIERTAPTAYHLGVIAQARGQVDEARRYLNQAVELSQGLGATNASFASRAQALLEEIEAEAP